MRVGISPHPAWPQVVNPATSTLCEDCVDNAVDANRQQIGSWSQTRMAAAVHGGKGPFAHALDPGDE